MNGDSRPVHGASKQRRLQQMPNTGSVCAICPGAESNIKTFSCGGMPLMRGRKLKIDRDSNDELTRLQDFEICRVNKTRT